jgi:hypothetical protein
VAAEGVVVEGSKGQPRPSGLLNEWRDTCELRARLLARIDVPESADGAWSSSPDHLTSSQRARKAARARWDNRYGA